MKHAIFIILMAAPVHAGASELCSDLEVAGRDLMYVYQVEGVPIEHGAQFLREHLPPEQHVFIDGLVRAAAVHAPSEYSQVQDFLVNAFAKSVYDTCMEQDF